jgi:hypothetical protein
MTGRQPAAAHPLLLYHNATPILLQFPLEYLYYIVSALPVMNAGDIAAAMDLCLRIVATEEDEMAFHPSLREPQRGGEVVSNICSPLQMGHVLGDMDR